MAKARSIYCLGSGSKPTLGGRCRWCDRRVRTVSNGHLRFHRPQVSIKTTATSTS